MQNARILVQDLMSLYYVFKSCNIYKGLATGLMDRCCEEWQKCYLWDKGHFCQLLSSLSENGEMRAFLNKVFTAKTLTQQNNMPPSNLVLWNDYTALTLTFLNKIIAYSC